MNAFRLTRILKLHETEEWSYVPFVQGNSTSFYTEIIENNAVTLAWVSIQKTICKNDLQIHHFKRQINSETGIKNSLPRLLIVTDGRKWFLSKAGYENFFSIKYSNILVILYNEIKSIINDLDISKETISLQKNLTATLVKLKNQIKVYGEKIQEAKIEPTLDLFSGTGNFLTEQHNSNMQQLKPLTDDEQLSRYSNILHQELFRRLHPKQIQFLLLYPEQDIFVNPFFRHEQFLVCISKNSLNILNDDHKKSPTYLIVDQYADTKELNPSVKMLQEILPTLLKIDTELVKKYLTKEAF